MYTITVKKGHRTNVLELWANDGTEIIRATNGLLFITRYLMTIQINLTYVHLINYQLFVKFFEYFENIIFELYIKYK